MRPVFLCLLLLSCCALAAAQSRLTIDRVDHQSIQDKKEVAFSALVEGTVDNPKLAVYVLVHAQNEAAPRAFAAVVDETHADPAGGYRWRAICRFGDMKGTWLGESFSVRAAAINAAKIQRGKASASLIKNGFQSNAITLKRAKK